MIGWQILFLMLGLSPKSFAEPRAFTLYEYFERSVQPGDVVCHVIDPVTNANQCFLTLSLDQVLDDKNDPSGKLSAHAVSPYQKPFQSVRIKELLADLDGLSLETGYRIDLYVKVSWTAKGASHRLLQDEQIVHGKLLISDTGAFQFKVTNIPKLSLIGYINPNRETAEVFGRKVPSENDLLAKELEAWMEGVVGSVLPLAFRVEGAGSKASPDAHRP
jgi:hypothetical protein